MNAEMTSGQHTKPLNSYLLSLMNMAIRGFSFVARFALSLYIARYLGLSDIGRFGIILGAVGFMPSLLGLGLNYFLSRDIIDVAPFIAGCAIRDRLAITLVMCCGVSLAWLAARRCGYFGDVPAIAVLITILEVFALDIHMSLIGLRQAIRAGALICVRTSSWVFFFIGISYTYPQLRHLDFALSLWLVALCLNYLLTFMYFSQFPLKKILTTKVDITHVMTNIKNGNLIYASDISIAGAMYADRFVINHCEGLVVTGIYIFFWSIANAAQVLISSSISQVALPRLVSAYKNHGVAAWRKALVSEATKVVIAGLCLSIFAFIGIKFLAPYIHHDGLFRNLSLFLLMLVASIIRMVSDIVNYGLYSRGQDRAFALTNIAGFAISPFLTFILLTEIGLIGVGLSMFVIAVGLLTVRFGILWMLDHQTSARPHHVTR
jgi:O-antigen/teichoic acid export membrane protein